jgi:hypothetical protein
MPEEPAMNRLKKRVYISGPMTGIKRLNKESFDLAEKDLISRGYEVINPASLPEGLEYTDYIDIAKILIKRCDAMYLLKGWENSKGAEIEIRHYLMVSKNICFMK